MLNNKKIKKLLSAFLIAGSLLAFNTVQAHATPTTYYSNGNIKYGFDNNSAGHLWIQTGAGNQIFYGSAQSASYPYLSVNGTFYNLSNIAPSYIDNNSVSSGIINKGYSAQAGVATSMRLSPVNNGRYVKYEVTLTNNNAYAVNAGFKEYWDTQVAGNDASPIEYLSTANGFRMYNGSVQLSVFVKDTFNVTDATSFWAGRYGTGMNDFSDVAMGISPGGTFSAGDSALYFKWAESYLPAYSSRTYSVIIGAGAINKNPIQNATSPSYGQSFSPGQTISLQGSMYDPDGPGYGLMNLSYGIDGSSQVSLPSVADSSSPYYYNYSIALPSYITIGSHTLNVWVTDKEGGVSSVQNIPFNVVDAISPSLTLTPSTTAWTNGNVSIAVNATDNIGVTQIQTPAGWINGGSTTYTVGSNGTYTFVAKDGAGNTTTRSITINNIDKTPPTLTLTRSTSWAKQITINATGSDTGGSGVVSITKPDGGVVSGNTASYTVSTNGTYSFSVRDGAGNVSTQSITVSTIDTIAPVLNLATDTNLITNQSVKITATASDSQSGIANITLPNGQVVSGGSATYSVTSNGTYSFNATDNVGNITTTSITVSNIVTINTISGIDRIEYKLDGATIQDWTTYPGSLTITNEGITSITVRAIDKAGNYSDTASSIVKLDRSKPINGNIQIIIK